MKEIKTVIESVYPASSFVESRNEVVYVADFGERTDKARKVEVHEICPSVPEGEDRLMDCLTVHNPQQLPVCFNVFDDNQFKDKEGKDIAHCEGCFFPMVDSDAWMAFLEIKDCKPKNISKFKVKARNQILSSAEMFSQKGILVGGQKQYGIISFPRSNKTDFNDFILGDIMEQKALKKATGITFIACNEITAYADKIIKFNK